MRGLFCLYMFHDRLALLATDAMVSNKRGPAKSFSTRITHPQGISRIDNKNDSFHILIVVLPHAPVSGATCHVNHCQANVSTPEVLDVAADCWRLLSHFEGRIRSEVVDYRCLSSPIYSNDHHRELQMN